MAVSESYLAYVQEQLARVVPVRARSMFGGVGLYAGDLFFAIISAEDRLYFKVDDTNRADYTAAGAERFMQMDYYELPGDVLEDEDALRVWVEKAVAVAAAAARGGHRSANRRPR